jgi:alkanesulfonate monooxygenase
MIELFSTCPPSSGVERDAYVAAVIDVARWSDAAGYKGILVYSDNALVDPWLLSHIIVQNTTALCPLVAVQPIYMHPYWVAKQVTSIAHVYGRRLYLNMVAGGFVNDLEALNDNTPHDKRYARLIEYTTIVMRLLSAPAPVTYLGEFHSVLKLKLTPPLPEALVPGVFVSGSSDAGRAAAQVLGATAVKYPKPADQEQCPDDFARSGIRVGIIARSTDRDAWSVAYEWFPEDRKGQLTHQLAMKVSDSTWHKDLSAIDDRQSEQSPYWLLPFHNYKTMCPYLVGSYDRVAQELSRYIALGCRTFILDVPRSREELEHTSVPFERALAAMGA